MRVCDHRAVYRIPRIDMEIAACTVESVGSQFKNDFSIRERHFRLSCSQRDTLTLMTAVRMLLLLFVGPVVAAPGALPARETLQYTVEWRLVTAGKARLIWSATPRQQNSSGPGWQADLHLESTGLVSKLFKVNNDYVSNLDPDLCSTGSYLKAEEGTRHKETRVTFNREARKAEYLEKDLDKKGATTVHEIDTPGCVHDVLGGLYTLRTLNLQPGQSTQMAISDGKKSVMARHRSTAARGH